MLKHGTGMILVFHPNDTMHVIIINPAMGSAELFNIMD